MAKRRMFGWLGNILLIIIATVLILFAVFMAQIYAKSNIGKMETQAKSNLHEIQLCVERYCVDQVDGTYPPYLIGGEPGNTGSGSASDPLLREGYLEAYPRNPFHRPRDQYKNLPVLELQKQLSKSTLGIDPLRPDSPEGDRYGYRFGKDGTLMGQVLCDARWPTRTHQDPGTLETHEYPTWADVEYRFWDVWVGKKPKPFMPGDFFYKATGIAWPNLDELIITEDDIVLTKDPIVYPLKIDMYMLGVYGSLRSKGKDVLGREGIHWLSLVLDEEEYPDLTFEERWKTIEYRQGLHSELYPDSRVGAPYSVHCEEVHHGSRNDIPDGVILVLTDLDDFWD